MAAIVFNQGRYCILNKNARSGGNFENSGNGHLFDPYYFDYINYTPKSMMKSGFRCVSGGILNGTKLSNFILDENVFSADVTDRFGSIYIDQPVSGFSRIVPNSYRASAFRPITSPPMFYYTWKEGTQLCINYMNETNPTSSDATLYYGPSVGAHANLEYGKLYYYHDPAVDLEYSTIYLFYYGARSSKNKYVGIHAINNEALMTNEANNVGVRDIGEPYYPAGIDGALPTYLREVHNLGTGVDYIQSGGNGIWTVPSNTPVNIINKESAGMFYVGHGYEINDSTVINNLNVIAQDESYLSSVYQVSHYYADPMEQTDMSYSQGLTAKACSLLTTSHGYLCSSYTWLLGAVESSVLYMTFPQELNRSFGEAHVELLCAELGKTVAQSIPVTLSDEMQTLIGTANPSLFSDVFPIHIPDYIGTDPGFAVFYAFGAIIGMRYDKKLHTWIEVYHTLPERFRLNFQQGDEVLTPMFFSANGYAYMYLSSNTYINLQTGCIVTMNSLPCSCGGDPTHQGIYAMPTSYDNSGQTVVKLITSSEEVMGNYF